ncbi:MAG: FlgD immunoglobulin-like domain containing protein [Candidatus Eisenbacteria bacterium]
MTFGKERTSARGSCLLLVALILTLVCPALALAQVDVTASVGTPAASYTTLKGAFDAINAGTHGGVIGIGISGNTTETAPAVLNASGSGSASYTSITVNPTGGAARTISGAIAAGSPLIDMNGADNVTFDGLNSGGNSLTISNTTASSTSGTSTIRFIGGATSNTITRCSVLGSGNMSVATNGANIFFSTDANTTNGNDNNTISNCDIGPAGANLPSKGILGNGSTTTTAIGNSGIVIDNNNIFDVFAAAVTSAGVAVNGGCNGWSITNNRFYQTTAKVWTTGALHNAILLNSSTSTSGVQGMTVTGNIIGYATNTQTGTYALSGSTGTFRAIQFNGITLGTVSNINSNTVASISVTGVTSSGTSSSAPFMGIYIANGLANANTNTIGSQSATGSLVFSTTSASAADVNGIFNFSVDSWTASNNLIGGITSSNAGTGAANAYGLRYNTGSTVSSTITGNTIGGTVANSIQSTSTATGTIVDGILASTSLSNITGNTIRNLTSAGGTGTGTPAMGGIVFVSTSVNNTVSQNTIHSISNTNASTSGHITGIMYTSSTGTNLIERNFIHSLTASSASATINGIYINAGTATYANNMIRLGLDASGTLFATGCAINGINETVAGTDNMYFNSVFIGGSGVGGAANTFAFQSSITTNTRNYIDNIFWNNRSNGAGTGKHYAIRVGGTAPNPGGLTSNYNDLLADGTGGVLGLFNAVDQANLGAWRTATGQDATSLSANPQFIAPNGTASTVDLHIHPTNPTPIEAAGLAIGSVTNDFDGQSRAGLTPTDMGADAGNFVPSDISPPAIAYTPLLSTCSTSARNLTATITDASGVPTSGIGLPVLYWKVNAGAYTAATASWTAGSSYDFSFGGGVSVGDVVSYYIVAQDNASPPNVGSQPGGGSGYTANPPAAGTPPPSPSTYTIQSTLAAGTYSIPGSYASLTAAVADYNTKCMGGPIVFELAAGYSSAGETFPITIGVNGDASSTNTLTIRPAAGQTPTISGSLASNALIKLNGADWVIIDGSNSGGTDRSLTITNTNTTAPSVVALVSLGVGAGATNDVIKNCNVSTGVATTLGYGISVGGSTPGTSGADNDNATVQNNAVTLAPIGIYAAGTASVSAGGDDNLSINGNSVDYNGSLASLGIQVGNATGSSIARNTVSEQTSSSQSPTAISLETGFVSSTVTANTITKAVTTNTGGYGGRGITVGTGTASSALTITNNFIAGVNGSNWSGFSNSSSMGIGIGMIGSSSTVTTTAGGINLYHNSISMTGSMGTGSTTAITAAIYVGTGASALNIQNNIFTNTQVATSTTQKNYGVYSATATNAPFTTISYNDYYVANSFNAGSAILGFLVSDQTTLAAFNTAFTGNANTPAFNANPAFTDNINLHIPAGTASLLESSGVAGTGVGVDIDNETRPGPPGSIYGGGTANDVGADEFDGVPVATNDMAATAFVDPTNGASRSVGVAFAPQASFTNLGLATQTNVTVRYRIVDPGSVEVYNQTFVIASIASQTATTVTFPNVTLTSSGTHSIYAAAELVGDQVPANDQISGTINLLQPLAGDYTVGVSAFNQATGLDLTFERRVQKVTREVREQVGPTPVNEEGKPDPSRATFQTVVREFEEETWVPMVNGQVYEGPLGFHRQHDPNEPNSGSYATLTAAIADLNGLGVSGPVRFLLTDATYPSETFPITANAFVGASSTNTVTIRPNTGVTSTISGSASSGALIKLNGADYLIIDGSNSGGTDRSLTLTNTATSAPCAIWIASLGNGLGATNDVVKNCNINTSSATSSTACGVAISGSTIISAGGDNDDLTVRNNAFASSNIGVYANGNAAVSAGGVDNLLVSQNTFSGTSTLATVYGVEVANALNAMVEKNTFNLTTSAAGAPVAISLEANVSNSSVASNQIQSVVDTNSGGYAGRGITVGTGTATPASITIANNFIAGVNGSNWSSFGNSSAMGIAVGVVGGSSTLSTTTAGVNIYHNSISMTGSMGSGSTTAITAGLYVGSGATVLDIRNNIISSTQVATSTTQKNYGVYSAAANTAYSSISYNDYYVANSFNAGSAILGFLGSDLTTLAAFNTAFTGNPNTPSLNVVAGFTSTVNLHIPAATQTQLESGGTAGLGVGVDIDNETRPGPPGSTNGGGTAPDLGADEFDGTPVAADDMAATAFVDPTNGGAKNVGVAFAPQASFTNAGVNAQTNVTVRYRIVGPQPAGPEVYNQTAVIPSIGNGVTTTVTFPNATLVAGGSYAIFASAELVGDLVPGNDQISGTMSALTPLAGDYTVGVSAFNQATGLDLTFMRRVTKVTRACLEPVDAPNSPSEKLNAQTDQIQWKTVVREVEEVSWVPMANGQLYRGPLRVTRQEYPNLPINSSGIYATITAAVADLNNRGVNGPVRFLLTDATYPSETFPITVNVTSAFTPNAINKVTIKPNTGVIATVSGASASNALFKVFNTNYITIDGSNAVDGTSRDLTLENTSATSPIVVWYGSNGTTPITNGTLKNCVVRNGINTNSAVVISDGTTAGNAGYFSTMEVRNNKIEKAYMGVYANGGTSPANGAGLTYVGNELNSTGANAIRFGGLYMQGVSGGTVANNDIGNSDTASAENDFGIWLATGTTGVTVNANRIHDLVYTGTSGYGPKGITISSGQAAANITVSNNMISNMAGDGDSYSSFGCQYNPTGIYTLVTGQGGVSIFANSIYLFGNTINFSSGAYSVGIGLDDNSAANVSGNAVVNNLGRLSTIGAGSVAIALETAATQLTAGDGNDLYCNATGGGANLVGKIAATDYITLADWQLASGRDGASISADPLYTSTSDLHLRVDVVSPASNVGPVIHTLTTDFDGDLRMAAPDIGADEIYSLSTSVLGSGSIQVSPIQVSYNGGTSVTLTAVPADQCQKLSAWSGNASGNTNPLVIVMDSNKSITATFVHIAPPTAAVTSPNGGEVWNADEAHDITWTASGDAGITSVDLAYSVDGGFSYPHVIATGLPNTGTYSWVVPQTPTTSARVRVTVHDPCGAIKLDSSDANFTIVYVPTSVADVLLRGGQVLGAYPNPATAGSTHILYRLPAGNVSLGIYDLSGRLVRQLTSGTFAGGVADVKWDGTDANGKNVGMGIYFVRLSTDRKVYNRRIMLMK